MLDQKQTDKQTLKQIEEQKSSRANATPTGFIPDGFEQASFLKYHDEVSESVKKKSGLLASKLFLVFTTVLMLVTVIGAGLVYNAFWNEDKSGVLVAFAKVDNLRNQHRSNIEDRVAINTNLRNQGYSPDNEEARHGVILDIERRIELAIAEYELESEAYNGYRDPEFNQAAHNYIEFINRCIGYAIDVNQDLHDIGRYTNHVRTAANRIDPESSSFNRLDSSAQTDLLSRSRNNYLSAKRALNQASYKTEEVTRVQEVLIELIDSNLLATEAALANLGTPQALPNLRQASSLGSDGRIDDIARDISSQFKDGVCWSDADDRLQEVYDDYDFDKEHESILKTLEILE